MSQELPFPTHGILAVSGVRQSKLDRYGAVFLDAIAEFEAGI